MDLAVVLIDRRQFLRLTGAGVGVAVLLDNACAAPAPNPAGSTTASGGSAVTLPTYAALQGAQPDFAGTSDGILPPAYMNYPRNPTRTQSQPVGKGDDVNAMMYTTQAPPTPVEQNTAWQQVNRE